VKRQKIRKLILLISFLFFPITLYYFSPYLVVVGAAKGIVVGSLIIFTLQLITSLFFGRLFCGWICPGGGVQESCKQIVDKRTRGGKLDIIKYLIWVPWISSIIFLLVKSGPNYQIDFFYETSNGVSVSNIQSYITFYGVLTLIVSLALIGGRRGFCHYSCWMAPFMIMGNKAREMFKIPSLNLVSDKSKCTGCKQCTKICQMSLNVDEMVKVGKMYNSECIYCFECVDICKNDVINIKFGKM
jgi:polyferredoxin